MDTLSLLSGLRFIDSFFPAGGFAFSSGLEAAVQNKAVTNGQDLSRYVEDLLRRGLGRREAVALGFAHDAVTCGRIEPALMADRELDWMKIGRESRLASRQMGRQVIRVAAEQMSTCNALRLFHVKIESGQTSGHLPVAIGLTLGACGWPRLESIAGYLYHSAVGLVSAAMKLMPIGQGESQRLLHEWTGLIVEISCTAMAADRMSSWTPIQDIYAMRHSRLESRLFRS